MYCSAQMRCETDRCSPCDGWKYSTSSGKCYKYFEHFTSYKWATTVCDNRGYNGYQAELASVPNQATNDFIVSQFIEEKQNLENFQDFGLWLGGKMVSGQNGEWVDGTPWGFTNWAPNYVFSGDLNEKRIVMMSTNEIGTWKLFEGFDGDIYKANLICQI